MRFVTIDGLTIHYTLAGDPGKPPLVFVHSLGTDLRIWAGLVPHLAADHRLVRYDLRGHGLSSCPPAPYRIEDFSADLAALLDHLEIDCCILAGISIGGQIGLRFALDHPEQVAALVLADTTARIGSEAFWQERITGIREKGLAAMAEAIAPRWFAEGFENELSSAYRGFVHMLSRTPEEGYIGACAALASADLRMELGRLEPPTLVLCGADDRATTPELVSAFAASLPAAVYREIPDAGHHPPVENPSGMAEAMRLFLEGLKN
jgi:3-oxoadipate enol-lactonase